MGGNSINFPTKKKGCHMLKKNYCQCCGKKRDEDYMNDIEITAVDFRDGWMKDNEIEIKMLNNKKISRLLAVRLCNKILEKANIDFVISELHMK